MYGNIATNMLQLVPVVGSDWIHLHTDSVEDRCPNNANKSS